ncbi:MAG TPA: hypothetical protein VGK67_40335 [Myxococcales bacterium]|jgi:hypothetical protein
MSGANELRGVCGGRPATLVVSVDAVEIRQAGAQEVARMPLAEGVQVSLTERGATGLFGTAGVFLLALGALWALNGSASPPAYGAAMGLGALLLAAGFAMRISVVEIKDAQRTLAFACRGKERAKAREVVETLRIDQPEHAKKPAASIAGFIQAELQALGSSEAERRREYRLVAGAKADAEMESRFVAARSRIALWNLLWTLAIPVAGAAVAVVVGLRWGTTEAVIGALSVFVVLVLVGLRILPRTQGVLARWIGRG